MLWESVTKIECFKGAEYPYIVRSKEAIQEIGDQIKELVMNNFEIQFLTDQEGHIIQNTLEVEHMGEATEFDVKLNDSTGRTKSAQVTLDRYKLTFYFDIETCEIFDIRKIVN